MVWTAGVTVAAAAEVTLRHTPEAATQRDQRAVLIPGFGLAGRVPVYSRVVCSLFFVLIPLSPRPGKTRLITLPSDIADYLIVKNFPPLTN